MFTSCKPTKSSKVHHSIRVIDFRIQLTIFFTLIVCAHRSWKEFAAIQSFEIRESPTMSGLKLMTFTPRCSDVKRQEDFPVFGFPTICMAHLPNLDLLTFPGRESNTMLKAIYFIRYSLSTKKSSTPFN